VTWRNKIKEIDVNGLNTSVEDLGIKFGSTGAEMENVNSKLFQNAINAGSVEGQGRRVHAADRDAVGSGDLPEPATRDAG
jgi:hypothetical protein